MSTRDAAYAAIAATRPRVQVTGDVVEQFMAQLGKQGGQCHRVRDDGAARAWLASLARADETLILSTEDRWLQRVLTLPGPALPRCVPAASSPLSGLALTTAIAAVAETGSLLLHPRAGAPMGLNFLSDRLVVLVRAADVLRNLEDLWVRVRAEFGVDTPRALSLVSGPSSSGDIGMQFAGNPPALERPPHAQRIERRTGIIEA